MVLIDTHYTRIFTYKNPGPFCQLHAPGSDMCYLHTRLCQTEVLVILSSSMLHKKHTRHKAEKMRYMDVLQPGSYWANENCGQKRMPYPDC